MLPPPQTQQYLTVLLTGTGGAIIFGRILAPPPPLPQTQQYLTIFMTGRAGAIIFCRILAPPPPQTQQY